MQTMATFNITLSVVFDHFSVYILSSGPKMQSFRQVSTGNQMFGPPCVFKGLAGIDLATCKLMACYGKYEAFIFMINHDRPGQPAECLHADCPPGSFAELVPCAYTGFPSTCQGAYAREGWIAP